MMRREPGAPAERPTYSVCPHCHGRGVATRGAMEAWQAFEELDALARTHCRIAKRRAQQRRAELMAIVMAYLAERMRPVPDLE
jgi:Ribonuclease G/E